MKHILIPLLLLGFSTQAQTKLTPELMWSLKRVSGDAVSTNGKTVFYTSRTYDVQKQKSTATQFALTVDNGIARPLPTKNVIQRTASYWYAKDDKMIYRSADNGKTWQNFFPATTGMDQVRVSPDEQHIVYSKEVLVKPMLGTDVHKDLPQNTAQIYTDLNYRHWDTWEDGKFSHLFVVNVKTGATKDIMSDEPYDCPQRPFGGSEDFIWSPDSKYIIYVSKKKFGKEYAQSTNTDLYKYAIKTQNTSLPV